MLDIGLLNILTINCNTIGKKKQIELPVAVQTQPSPSVQDTSNTINTKQETSKPRRCYTNKSSNLNLDSNSADKPMINNNEIEYFPPDPKQDNERRASTKITKQLQRDLKMFLVEEDV